MTGAVASAAILPFAASGAGAPAGSAPSAAAPSAQSLFVDLWPILLGLVVVAIVGYLVIVVARRYARTAPDAAGGFSLDDLRRLHRAGKLSDEEFTRAKDTMLAAARESARRARAPKDRPNRGSRS